MKQYSTFQVACLSAWVVVLAGALTHPLLAPGALALRDMLVLPHPALSPQALGTGDHAARNAPQDGVLAMVGVLIDASWFARLFILAAALLGGVGVWWLATLARKHAGLPASAWAAAAAITVAVANPLVVERLLQGQWSLVIAIWLLPLITAAGLAERWQVQALAVWAASLTPTGLVLAALVGLASARGWATRLLTAIVAAASSLPWLVPTLSSRVDGTSLAHSAFAFAPRAEAFASTPGTLLGLGGIWNAEAVPASREAGFTLFGVVLCAVLAPTLRRVPKPLLFLAALGMGWALASWLLTDATSLVVAHVPGGGLLRDAQKWVTLVLPAYVLAASLLNRSFAIAALAAALVQVPDAPLAVQQLRPVPISTEAYEHLNERAQGRQMYFPDRPDLAQRPDGTTIIDPAIKATGRITSGALSVDGQLTDVPSDRYRAVERAWAERDMTKLSRLGIGLVITPDGEVVETSTEPPRLGPGIALTLGWMALGGLLSWLAFRGRGRAAAAQTAPRSRPKKSGRTSRGRPRPNAGGGKRR